MPPFTPGLPTQTSVGQMPPSAGDGSNPRWRESQGNIFRSIHHSNALHLSSIHLNNLVHDFLWCMLYVVNHNLNELTTSIQCTYIHTHTRAYVYINTHVPIFLRTNHNHIYNKYHLQYLVILSNIYIMHHAKYDYIQYYTHAYIYNIYNWCTMITCLYIFLFFCSCMPSFFTPRFHHDKGTDSWHLRAPPDVERPVKHPHNILTFSDKRRTPGFGDIDFMTFRRNEMMDGVLRMFELSDVLWCYQYIYIHDIYIYSQSLKHVRTVCRE